MPDTDPDDLFREPNDDAYLKKQVRVGPPLEYVAEKLRNGLISAHDLLHDLTSLKVDDNLISLASYAFRSQLVAYMALHNMMALLNDDDFFARMERYSRRDFNDWIDRISKQGSVT